jgi:predicted N-acetyltransferase YhbS
MNSGEGGPVTSNGGTAGVCNRAIAPGDLAAVSELHARVFGPGRFARTAYRVREGARAVSPHCRGAFLGPRLIASLRMTEVSIGRRGRHLLLGPLAVDPAFAGQGFGKALVSEVLSSGRTAGFATVVLVGDEPYYGRFGFKPVRLGQITFPGPVDPARILAVDLTPGGLAAAHGLVQAAS